VKSREHTGGRKVVTAPGLQVDQAAPSLVPAAGIPLVDREVAVLADEQAILQREEGARLREEGACLREAGANRREKGAELREAGAGLREQALSAQGGAAVLAGKKAIHDREEGAGLREEGASLREEGASRREESASRREEGADLREKGLDARREAAKVHARASRRTEADLREANERLVIATVHAQTMSDSAKQAAAQMAHMAEHDFLTGLPNRSLVGDRLAQAIILAKRHDKKVALLFMDLDRFKHVNDSLGHEVGDKLLQSVASRLSSCVRHSDTVSRQGGDEFVILLTEVDGLQDATLAAEKLLKAMDQAHLIGKHRLHVTLSIGISLFPDDGKDAETMLRNADTAMYQAKRSGGKQYQVFTPEMNVNAVELHAIEQALYRALEHQEFVVHYQPKVNLETGAITGAEALIRWQRSDNQLDGPTHFVNVAENCGLILPIDKWVLREACRQTQEWLDAGLDLGHIAVNVSALEFHSKDFLAGVRAIITDTGLDPRRLEIELTESVLMQDSQQTTVILQSLKDLGVRIAVDDFGTGYSSLGYLQRFPVNTLKIDQSFVQNIDNDTGETIVSAVIALGKSLKLRVVAEGIETSKQLAFLQSHQCAEGQGYYFGRPLAASAFAALLATPRS
jgi:diguanylate cyclase